MKNLANRNPLSSKLFVEAATCKQIIYSTRRHLTITLTGVLDTYIIVNGIGKILSQNRTYSFNFYLKS